MTTIMTILRKAGAFAISTLGTIAAFGLLRGLLWISPLTTNEPYRISVTLLAAASSLVIGGGLYRLLGRGSSPVFGMLFGFFSFMYINGLSYLTLAAIPFCGLLAALGGRIINPRFIHERNTA